jgi:hypothetical protein
LAGKFDDEQLRVQALKLSDPYDQGNLVWTVPKGANLLDIMNIYVYEQYPGKSSIASSAAAATTSTASRRC